MKATELIHQLLYLQDKKGGDPEVIMVDSEQILIAELAKGSDKVLLQSFPLPITQGKTRKRLWRQSR